MTSDDFKILNIFAHQFSLDTPITRLVDKKLRQKIAEKKLAHGQKLEM